MNCNHHVILKVSTKRKANEYRLHSLKATTYPPDLKQPKINISQHSNDKGRGVVQTLLASTVPIIYSHPTKIYQNLYLEFCSCCFSAHLEMQKLCCTLEFFICIESCYVFAASVFGSVSIFNQQTYMRISNMSSILVIPRIILYFRHFLPAF